MSYTNAVVATPTVSLTYDQVYDRVASMTDGTGTTTYGYNPVNGSVGSGQLASVDGPLASDTVTYTYDELARVASRGVSGFTSSMVYDSLDRLTTQVSPVGSFTYGYDGINSRRLSLSYPNGQTTQYLYFPNSGDHRLRQIKHLAPGGAVISKYDYAYDVVGNIVNWTQQIGAATPKVYTFAYDAADQLSTAKVMGPTPLPVPNRFAYAYDAVGNRIAEQLDDAVSGATYNNRNHLTSQQPGGALLFRGGVNEAATVAVGGKPAQVAADNSFAGQATVPSGPTNVVVTATDPNGNVRTNTYQVSESGATTTFNYDLNGNLAGDGTRTFEWDAENRLTAVKQAAVTLAGFTYDGEGRRATKVAGSITTTYVYDDEEIIEERLSSGGTKRYVHGVDIDEPLAIVQGSATSYLLADHLGSIVQVTDASGVPTLTREYDAWGNQTQGNQANGYAFTGREWDAETGLYYYRARYYSAELGRFISEDPFSTFGGINLLAYVGNNPVAWNDPFGYAKGSKNPDAVYYICCKNGSLGFCRGQAPLPSNLDVANCMVAHELRHILDIQYNIVCPTDKIKCTYKFTKIFEGEAVGPNHPEKKTRKAHLKALECRGYCAELTCLGNAPKSPEVSSRVSFVKNKIKQNCVGKECGN